MVFDVLSLFDGISTGQLALERAGIDVSRYHASEIDENAVKITVKHFPNTYLVGDVTKLESKWFKGVDLLIGGSPCQGFSVSGKRMYFKDDRSKLLLDYVRLKNELQPKWFLLENVKMPKHCTDIIDELLGVKHVVINSKLFSAQDRKRLYWTNIPIAELPNNPLVVNDILESNVTGYTSDYTAPLIRLNPPKRKIGYFGKDSQANRVYDPSYKGVCLCGEAGGGGGKTGFYEINGVVRKLTPVECERMQTMPDNYTEGLTDSQRYRALGNGWTCDVIAHIFRGITL